MMVAWNKMKIIVVGNKVITYLNGNEMVAMKMIKLAKVKGHCPSNSFTALGLKLDGET